MKKPRATGSHQFLASAGQGKVPRERSGAEAGEIQEVTARPM